MSDRSQKILRNLAAAVLVIVFVVFAVLFFTGRVGDFIGIESGLSSDAVSEGGSSSVQSVRSSVITSVQSAPTSTAANDASSAQSERSSVITGVQSVPTSTAESVVSSVQSTQSSVITSVQSTSSETVSNIAVDVRSYKFRNKNLLNQHYEKHGKDMGFSSAEEYEKAAAAVPNNPAALHKTEKEDGDDVYYIESTNEFVVVSTDRYIRTYFNPDRGIDYYNKQ